MQQRRGDCRGECGDCVPLRLCQNKVGNWWPVLNNTFTIPFQLLRVILIVLLLVQAARRRRATDLHLDLGQAVLQFALLLRQLRVERAVLRLDRVQAFAQPFDFILQDFMGAQQGGVARQL